MTKVAFYKQNNGQISTTPPSHLGPIASATWRKIVPYLLSTKSLARIDSFIVEQYCISYEVYRKAYDDIVQNGLKTKIYKDVQNNKGEVIDRVMTSERRNPSEQIKNDASSEMTRLGEQLGLSPKARQELQQLAASDDSNSIASFGKQLKQFVSGGGGDS